MTDRIKSAFGWDVDEEGARPIFADRIARITDRRIDRVEDSEMDEDR